jgi:hypothetical protein
MEAHDLSTPAAPGRQMLQVMWDAFAAAGEWPTFQYVSAILWREVELEPRDVYYELGRESLVLPRIDPQRAFQLRDDTRIGISLKGLMYVDDAQSDLGRFVDAVRYIGSRASRFRPSSSTTPEDLRVSSEEIRLASTFAPSEPEVVRLAALIRDRAPALWTSFNAPGGTGEWSLTVSAELARRYGRIQTLIEFFEVEDEIRGAEAALVSSANQAVEVPPTTGVVANPSREPNRASVVSATDDEVLSAAQDLEENIEDLRHRVARGIRTTTFWTDLLVWNMFEDRKEVLRRYPTVLKPVSDAYRSFRQLNEIVPEPRLGSPIPEDELAELEERVGQMTHATEKLTELIATLAGRGGPPHLSEPERPHAQGPAQASVTDHPSAFISWAHGGDDWLSAIATLAFHLRRLGLAADVDLFHFHDTDVNWSTYGTRAIQEADFVLIAASEAYKERWEGTNDPREGAGSAREAAELKAMFEHDQELFRRRVKVLVLPGTTAADVPGELLSLCQRFVLTQIDDASLEELLRTLTHQPAFPAPPVGEVPVLPPKLLSVVDPDPAERAAQLRQRLEQLQAELELVEPTENQRRSNLASEHRTVEAAFEVVGSSVPTDAGSDDRAAVPAIYGLTTELLRHLDTAGPRTERELEAALGDVDQIGQREVAEWATWACSNGTIARLAHGDRGHRWQITDKGRRVLSPTSSIQSNDQEVMRAAREYRLEPLRDLKQRLLIEACRASIHEDHRTFDQLVALCGLAEAELRNLLDRAGP